MLLIMQQKVAANDMIGIASSCYYYFYLLLIGLRVVILYDYTITVYEYSVHA